LTQIGASDHQAEEDEADGVECSKAYKMLIQLSRPKRGWTRYLELWKVVAQRVQRVAVKFEMKLSGK
jgi:hypothetical protein